MSQGPTKHNTWAVVVWYHPTNEHKQALELYKDDVEHVIVVDNTDNNVGIATALNKGCREALDAGAEWVLTMDQDSRWDKHTVTDYLHEANQYEFIAQTAIFSPFQDSDGCPERHHRQGRFEQRNAVMCSGNLLRLQAWQQAGGFQDDWFIDLVDDELCCHVRELGWQVVRCNQILLTHYLGQGAQAVAYTHHLYTPHPVWRYYYIGRNLHRIILRYPSEAKRYHKAFHRELKRLCLYDSEHKIQKIHTLLKGWKEGKA